jgi:hypothetical protein
LWATDADLCGIAAQISVAYICVGKGVSGEALLTDERVLRRALVTSFLTGTDAGIFSQNVSDLAYGTIGLRSAGSARRWASFTYRAVSDVLTILTCRNALIKMVDIAPFTVTDTLLTDSQVID